MFIGHYGIAYVVKKKASDIPLWLLFASVQLMDIIGFTFTLLGIEKVHTVPNVNHLLRYITNMPYSHSLSGTLVALVAVYIFFRAIDKKSWAWILGLCVLSHWFIDLIVHTPDLGIFFNSCKVGLGLWYYPILTYITELVFFIIGWILLKKNIYSYFLLILMAGAATAMIFADVPPIFNKNISLTAAGLLIFTLLSIFIAYLWDRKNKKYSTDSGYRDSRYIYKNE
jgi:hypothetical protein